MKIRQAAPAALWVLTLVLGCAALRAAATRPNTGSVEIASVRRAPGIPVMRDREQLQGYADSLRRRNPFRLERGPTSQPYGAAEVAEIPHIEPQIQPRPVLSVGGIVGGPPWRALIEGIPGQEAGIVLAVGEEWNGFRLEWVRRDSVMVVTPDTTWILPLKQVWR